MISNLALVVQTLDSAIRWINHYPLGNSIGFASVYPLDSDLSGGQCYPSFEQLGAEEEKSFKPSRIPFRVCNCINLIAKDCHVSLFRNRKESHVH